MKIKKILLSKQILTFVLVLSISFSFITADRALATDLDSPLQLAQQTLSAAGTGISAASAPIAAAAGVAGTGIAATKLTWDVVGVNILSSMAYATGQNLLKQLTNQTVKWIQGGFRGSPNFSVDLEEAALQAADSIAGELVLSLRNIETCDFDVNYKDNLKNAVELYPKYKYIYNQKAVCPFNNTTYNFTAQMFYDDFNKGAWDGFDAALKAGGNPYSLQSITAKEMAGRKSVATANNDKKQSWSNGYADMIDTDDCNYPPDIVLIPNSMFLEYGDPGYDVNKAGEKQPNPKFDDRLPPTTNADADKVNAKWKDPAFVKEIQKKYCKTTTPGKILSDQLGEAFHVNADKLQLADNLNKIVAAFMDLAMQKTVRAVFGGPKTEGAPTSFVAPKPLPSTTPALFITANSAYLNGYLASNGASINTSSTERVRVWFSYGKDGVAGAPINFVEVTGIEIKDLGQSFSLQIENLDPNSPYFFNTHVTTGGQALNSIADIGVIKHTGAELTFQTLPLQ